MSGEWGRCLEASYAWITYGGITVYVADVDGEDEAAIMRQIEAMSMSGWV